MTDHVKRVDLVLADELQEVVPVLVDGGLAVTDQTDTGLHQSADVEVVGLAVELVCVIACNSKKGERMNDVVYTYVTSVHSSNSDSAKRLDGSEHFIQEFRGIRLKTEQGLEVVSPSLGIFTSGTLKADVWASIDHLLQLRGDRFSLGELREINRLELGHLCLEPVQTPCSFSTINQNDTAGAVEESKLGAHLADRTTTPDRDYISWIDARVGDTMPRRAENVGKVKTFLVRDIIRKLKQVDIAIWHADVFCLATSKPSSEVRVSEDTCDGVIINLTAIFEGFNLPAVRPPYITFAILFAFVRSQTEESFSLQ